MSPPRFLRPWPVVADGGVGIKLTVSALFAVSGLFGYRYREATGAAR